MHEMSIAESIVEIIRETLGEDNHRKLVSVTVEVGELTAVVPESLEFCFNAIIETTPYRGAKIHIKNVPLTGQCPDCEKEFPIQKFSFVCPECGSRQIKILGGQELKVSELEVEDNGTGNHR